MVKVIPQSDAYRDGWDRVEWGIPKQPISDPSLDDPIKPYGGRPVGGFPVPMSFVERASDG